MENLKTPSKFGSHKNAIRFLLLFISIVSYIWYMVYHGRVNPDEGYSLAQAVSFNEGAGLTIKSSQPGDVSAIKTVYSSRFPPGMALLFSLGIDILKSPGTVDLVIEIISATIFFLAWFWILGLYRDQITFWGEMYLWLLWILIPSPLMAGAFTAHTSETLSLALFMASVIVGVQIAASNDPKKILPLGILMGVLEGFAATLRYLYWPMLIILPVALFLFGLLKKKLRFYFQAIIVSTAISALFIFGMMYLNWQATGQVMGYLDLYGNAAARLPEASALHWEHLLRTIPFPIFTFGVINPSFDIAGSWIETPPIISNVYGVSWVISLIVLAAFAFFVRETFPSAKTEQASAAENDRSGFFTLTGLVTVIFVFFLLAYISIGMELHRFGGGWVPVMELRYYSAIFPFTTLGVVYMISKLNAKTRRMRFISILTTITAVSFLLVAAVWRFQISYAQLTGEKFYYTGDERFENETKYLTRLSDNFDKRLPVVVVYPLKDTTIRRLSMIDGYVVCPLASIPPDIPLAAYSPVNMLLVYRKGIDTAAQEYFGGLVESYNGVCMDEGQFVSCYILFAPKQ
ncbi:MAG: hypothetical protein HY864_11440 [Chloroflexi bacterium]|nr:hypothetical protein [Chloroflexota bacterium]